MELEKESYPKYIKCWEQLYFQAVIFCLSFAVELIKAVSDVGLIWLVMQEHCVSSCT